MDLRKKIKNNLKSKFYGLDDVIDKLLDIVIPWKELNIDKQRPTIVNLWGMTGVGKTALVIELAKQLDIELIRIQNHEFLYETKTMLAFSKSNKKILLIDDIHNIGKESGKFISFDEKNKYTSFIFDLLSEGKFLQRNNYNYVPLDYFKKIELIKHTMNDSESIKFIDDLPFQIWEIFGIYKSDKENQEIYNNQLLTIIKNNDIEELFKSVKDYIFFNVELSSSLFFITGNIDNLFYNSSDLSPDNDVDDIYNNIKKVTIPDVKRYLLEDFEPSYVSRFGNNHIIFPSLTKKTFINIITNEIKNYHKFCKNIKKTNIKVDKSLIDMLYKEGVYPSQGARAILSTLHSYMDVFFNNLSYIFEKDGFNKNNSIILSYGNNKIKCQYSDLNGNIKEYEEHVDLYLTDLRKINIKEETPSTCVHEAGHAICYMALSGDGKYPEKITAYTANSFQVGFTKFINKNKKISFKKELYDYVSVCLAGTVAESIIFGEDNISNGAYIDLMDASRIVMECVSKCGFGKYKYHVENETRCSSDEFPNRYNEIEEEVKNVLDKCKNDAMNVLLSNKKFLIDLANEIMNNAYLDSKQIKIVSDRNNFIPNKQTSFIDKFKNIKSDFNIL